VKCAVEVQQAIRRLDASDAEDQQLRFRIGVHVGDVVVQGSDLLGDAINIASRLQSLAEPGAVCLSGPTHEYVRKACL
jgi:adenylate cyclase